MYYIMISRWHSFIWVVTNAVSWNLYPGLVSWIISAIDGVDSVGGSDTQLVGLMRLQIQIADIIRETHLVWIVF